MTRLTAAPLMLFGLIATAAQAADDPWLPPAARHAPLAAETRGAALQRQVMDKLEAQFQRADTAGRGALTKAEAERAGWRFAVQHFDAIDQQRRGEIRAADLRAFLVRRQAAAGRETIGR